MPFASFDFTIAYLSEHNISDELANHMTMPLMAPATAQFAEFMFEGKAQLSQFYISGFERMSLEFKAILEKKNQTVLQLFQSIAIE